MPLFVPVPGAGVARGGGSGGRSSGSIGQLMRIWFALPTDCPESFVITPLVTPGDSAF